MKKETEHTLKRYNTISLIYNLMEWPVELLLYKEWRKNLWNKIEGSKLLEIGVGTGKNIPFYPEKAFITAIDLSPKMLNKARKYLQKHSGKKVTLREMDAQKLDFEDSKFDSVIATFAFCSIPDPVEGLQEALRVTKPRGRLYLLEHMISEKQLTASMMQKIDPLIHFISGVHIARNTVKNVEYAGWKIESVKHLTQNGVFRFIQAVKP